LPQVTKVDIRGIQEKEVKIKGEFNYEVQLWTTR
jgi:hypothetical protein